MCLCSVKLEPMLICCRVSIRSCTYRAISVSLSSAAVSIHEMKLAITNANLNARQSWLASTAQPPLAIVFVTTFWQFHPVFHRVSVRVLHELLSFIGSFLSLNLQCWFNVCTSRSHKVAVLCWQASIVHSRNAVSLQLDGC